MDKHEHTVLFIFLSSLTVPPTVKPINQTTSIEVEAGSNVTLSVSILYDIMEYLPLTNISWTQPENAEVTIDSALPAHEGPVNSSLHLFSMSPAVSGLYTLTAINDEGNTTITFNITGTQEGELSIIICNYYSNSVSPGDKHCV